MKGSVDKGELQKKLSNIQNVVDRKNTMPILNHFLLSVSKEGSYITATDLETAFKEPVNVRVAEEGSICIPAKKLFEIVKEIEGDLTIESVDGQWIKVTSGKSHFRLACLPDKEFPVWPNLEGTDQLDIPGAMLLQVIDKSLYAAGESDTRYVLNGLLFHFKNGGRLVIVGTDGHRLALSEKSVAASFGEEKKVILSRKAVGELRRFIDEETETVRMVLGKNHVEFAMGDMQFLTRMIEGTYPNYEQVVPVNNPKNLVVERGDLIKALRRVSIMSKEKSNAVKIEIDRTAMVISANNPDLGEAKDEIAAEFSDEPMAIAFNARYLLDALNVMATDKVCFKMNEALSAVLLTEDGVEDYRCVVMPMRL